MESSELPSSLLVRDSWLNLVEAFALAVLSVGALAISRFGDWQWTIPVALAAGVLIAGAVHAVGTWTRLVFDADSLHVLRAFGARHIPWDRIRACEYDFEEAKLRLYWQPEGNQGRWDNLVRGNPIVRDKIRSKAQAEGPLDDLIKLPGPDRGVLLKTFDPREAVDGVRQACVDVAREIGREDLASEWLDVPFGDFHGKLNEASSGAGDRAQQLAHDRMFARLPAGSVPPARRHPSLRDAIGSLTLSVAAVTSIVVAADAGRIDGLGVGIMAIVIAAVCVSPQARRYLIGAGVVGGLAAGAVAAIQGVDGALITLVVVVGVSVIWVLLTLAAHGEFDRW